MTQNEKQSVPEGYPGILLGILMFGAVTYFLYINDRSWFYLPGAFTLANVLMLARALVRK